MGSKESETQMKVRMERMEKRRTMVSNTEDTRMKVGGRIQLFRLATGDTQKIMKMNVMKYVVGMIW